MRCCIAALLVCACTAAQAHTPALKPKVPPGTDPGGIAIAIVGYGLDYTDPEIARRLARDGEGEIIGWDLVDGDNRPYARTDIAAPPDGSDGTRLAKLLLSTYSHARLVPVRIVSFDPPALSQAMSFVVRTPARIVAFPVSSAAAQDWLRQRAGLVSQMLFVVSVVDDRTGPAGERPVEAAPGNLLAVAADTTLAAQKGTAEVWIEPRLGVPATVAEAVIMAAALAGCTQHGREPPAGFELKADLLALAQPEANPSGRRLIEPKCPFNRSDRSK